MAETDRDDTQGLDPAADAPESPETHSEPAGEDGGADLDTLLREFEGGERAPEKASENHGTTSDWQENEPAEPQPQDDRRLDEMMRWAEGMESERLQHAKRSEFETLRQHVEEQISDLPQASQVPDGFVQDALLAAYHTDPQLSDAWDRLWQERDNVALDRYRSTVRQQVKRLRGKLENLPDPKVNSDMAAVRAAVTGSGTAARSGDDGGIDARKVAQMSDGEFEQFVKSTAR